MDGLFSTAEDGGGVARQHSETGRGDRSGNDHATERGEASFSQLLFRNDES